MVAVSLVGRSEAVQTPAEPDGYDFAIAVDTVVLEGASMLVLHYRLQIHLFHPMMLARAMDRERSRQSTPALRVR